MTPLVQQMPDGKTFKVVDTDSTTAQLSPTGIVQVAKVLFLGTVEIAQTRATLAQTASDTAQAVLTAIQSYTPA